MSDAGGRKKLSLLYRGPSAIPRFTLSGSGVSPFPLKHRQPVETPALPSVSIAEPKPVRGRGLHGRERRELRMGTHSLPPPASSSPALLDLVYARMVMLKNKANTQKPSLPLPLNAALE